MYERVLLKLLTIEMSQDLNGQIITDFKKILNILKELNLIIEEEKQRPPKSLSSSYGGFKIKRMRVTRKYY